MRAVGHADQSRRIDSGSTCAQGAGEFGTHNFLSGGLCRLLVRFGRRAIRRPQVSPIHVGAEVFTAHSTITSPLYRGAALGGHLSPARYPLTDCRRRYAQQDSQTAHTTHRSTRFLDWFLLHGRESKALPNVRQEALPNGALDESN